MTTSRFPSLRMLLPLALFPALTACPDDPEPEPSEPAVAEGIFAERLGQVVPYATEEQQATFLRGQEVAMKRFTPEDGLGPTTNVSFCGSCHERPVLGGGGPRYRDFYLEGTSLADGSYVPGNKNGVLTSYGYHGEVDRTPLTEGANVVVHRNPIPFFGVGLIAELPEESILANEDPDDADGDGISGRANYDRGFVGRFGRKAQTVSIEGFIRGPLNNHLGITSDPLTEDQKSRLPIDSSDTAQQASASPEGFRQAAAPEEPLADADPVADPELAPEELFDLVSFSMLLAPPAPDAEPSEAAVRGRALFDQVNCSGCHVRGLVGERGLLPLYSDLLLHDMGEAMADSVVMQVATGSEFRTQPLWGVAVSSPYLHDGRADTLADAIEWHGGEASSSRDAYAALSEDEQADVIAFLESLGGSEQRTAGLLPPDFPIPQPGTPGAPLPLADAAAEQLWLEGRALFDDDFTIEKGLGPVFNGDSCRACHFDPIAADGLRTVGGAGPLGVNVMRHGTLDADGNFTAPAYGTILHKLTTFGIPRREHDDTHNLFEQRQTPTVLGLGLLESVEADDLFALEDPTDLDGDGILGVVHDLGDGRVGRLGWKAQVPNVREFVRDAMTAELGVTVPSEDGFTYGVTADDDDVADPELTTAEIDATAFFIANLAPPMPTEDVAGGLDAFEAAGCDGCHIPEIPGSGEGFPTPAYTDLLLHSVAAPNTPGIDDGMALGTLFRTAPLWGLSGSAPYLHDGAAATVTDAIAAHDGEAQASRAAFDALSGSEQDALIRFLETR
ncbi:MAG: hypothetical protein K0V04_14040 [Deltaproteobacteria bacterium]|nr:hypothetical protein [Deltaproteobacteria bacterium]